MKCLNVEDRSIVFRLPFRLFPRMRPVKFTCTKHTKKSLTRHDKACKDPHPEILFQLINDSSRWISMLLRQTYKERGEKGGKFLEVEIIQHKCFSAFSAPLAGPPLTWGRGAGVSHWNQTLGYLNNGRNPSPFQIVKAGFCQERDSERQPVRDEGGELWSVSSLTGMTFLFLFAWQKPIVSGSSRRLIHIIPIKERKLDIYISQDWGEAIVGRCWMWPFSRRPPTNGRVSGKKKKKMPNLFSCQNHRALFWVRENNQETATDCQREIPVSIPVAHELFFFLHSELWSVQRHLTWVHRRLKNKVEWRCKGQLMVSPFFHVFIFKKIDRKCSWQLHARPGCLKAITMKLHFRRLFINLPVKGVRSHPGGVVAASPLCLLLCRVFLLHSADLHWNHCQFWQ